MSRTVSLYSGAKVAQTSTPQADQHISQSQTSASWRPPHASPESPSLFVRLALSKLPFRNGRIIITNSGTISSTPAA